MDPRIVRALESIAQAQQTAFLPQHLVDWAQVALVIFTALTLFFFWRYTAATVALLKATRDQVNVSNQLLREAQIQNEASIRPILQMVSEVKHPMGAISYFLRNLGTGPAFGIAVESVQCSKGVYLFRHTDTLAREEASEIYPLLTTHTQSATQTHWTGFLKDTQALDKPVNLLIRYTNASASAYLTHQVISWDGTNRGPVTTLLKNGRLE